MPAFGRNDKFWVWEREQTTTTATADFSAAAASAPPSVEMTILGFGREDKQLSCNDKGHIGSLHFGGKVRGLRSK
jgi:hypothetical protein